MRCTNLTNLHYVTAKTSLCCRAPGRQEGSNYLDAELGRHEKLFVWVLITLHWMPRSAISALRKWLPRNSIYQLQVFLWTAKDPSIQWLSGKDDRVSMASKWRTLSLSHKVQTVSNNSLGLPAKTCRGKAAEIAHRLVPKIRLLNSVQRQYANRTTIVYINVTLRRICATIVAVEKQ